MTQRVLVIGGGESAEHDVSVASAAGIAAALRERSYEVDEVTIARNGVWEHAGAALAETPAASLQAAVALIEASDAVFPAIHGPLGEDGTLAALCTLAHVPVVGSGLRTGAIAMDKWATKLVAEAIGIPTAGGVLVTADELDGVEYSGPVVVKPVQEGSSFGVSLVRDAAELRPALDEAARFDDRILIEEVLHGREIDVAVLGDADGSTWAAPPLEIHATGFFDTETKYDGSAKFTVPAELDAADLAALEQAAIRMYRALGCAGVARVDFFLTADGPVLNEVNTMPGMTAASQVPRMFAAADIDYPELVHRLVQAALA